jgi:hypothetical protein
MSTPINVIIIITTLTITIITSTTTTIIIITFIILTGCAILPDFEGSGGQAQLANFPQVCGELTIVMPILPFEFSIQTF